jgi:hypothetical protein
MGGTLTNLYPSGGSSSGGLDPSLQGDLPSAPFPAEASSGGPSLGASCGATATRLTRRIFLGPSSGGVDAYLLTHPGQMAQAMGAQLLGC